MPARETTPVYLSPEELERLLAAADKPRDRLALELLFYSGGRASEVLTASVGDLTPNGVRLRNLKRRDHRAVKDVVLPIWFRDKLAGFAVGMPLNAPLVAHLDDPMKPISRQHLWRVFRACAERAGIYKRRHPDEDFRLAWVHTSRHSHAAHLVEAGVNLPTIADQLGHSGLANMWVYARMSDPTRVKMIQEAYT